MKNARQICRYAQSYLGNGTIKNSDTQSSYHLIARPYAASGGDIAAEVCLSAHSGNWVVHVYQGIARRHDLSKIGLDTRSAAMAHVQSLKDAFKHIGDLKIRLYDIDQEMQSCKGTGYWQQLYEESQTLGAELLQTESNL